MSGGYPAGAEPQREVNLHKFKVQMYDFSCSQLQIHERGEPYLTIDFDHFKVFKTDREVEGNTEPEWGFKAGFQYSMNYLEKLGRKYLKVQCFNRKQGDRLVGEAQVDLSTVALGPHSFRLTLRDRETKESRGILNFTCVMKLISPNVTVFLKGLELTMQGSAAPARIDISTTLQDDINAKLPHSADGTWAGPQMLQFATTLSDMLKAPAMEVLEFTVIDQEGMTQGRAQLPFRSVFTPKVDKQISFTIDVIYCSRGEGDDDVTGTVGKIEGIIWYQNLPSFAQMVGGVCLDDGQIEGGMLLIQDLPFPKNLPEAPPVWEDPEKPGGVLGDEPQLENESRLDAIDDDTLQGYLDQIDLPPPWEKRREQAPKGKMYFHDPRSKRATWKDPRFMPENWDQRIDPNNGRVYYQYHKTRNTTYQDPRGCPNSWDMRLSKQGEVYFAYMPAMKTTFTDPRGLPDHIEAALDDFGRMYFRDHSSKTTTWSDPRQEQAEVTLAKWRQAQMHRWLKETVLREIEEMREQAADLDEGEDAEMEI